MSSMQREFLAAMESFGVNVKVRRATGHMQRIKIPETPSIVVNGRYLVRGTSVDDTLRIASALIEQEHVEARASERRQTKPPSRRFQEQPIRRVLGFVPVRVAELREMARELGAIAFRHLHAG